MNRPLARAAALFLTAVLGLSIAACGDNGNAASGGGDGASAKADTPEAALDGKKVGIIYLALDDPFYQAFQRGAKAWAKEHNVDLIEQDGRKDGAEMANQVEQFVTQQVDGIIFSPIDAAAAVTPIKSAQAAKIPIVVNSIKQAEGAEAPFAGLDEGVNEVKLGKQTADLFHEKFGADAKIKLMTEECPVAEVSTIRADAFIKGLKEVDPDLEIIKRVDGGCVQEDSVNAMEDALQNNDPPNMLYGVNGIATVGGLIALQAKNLADPEKMIAVATNGAEQEIVEGIKPTSPLQIGVAISPVKLAAFNFGVLGDVMLGKIDPLKNSDHLMGSQILSYKDCAVMQEWLKVDLLSKTGLGC
jgi:ribose transport system substrate-binding protein